MNRDLVDQSRSFSATWDRTYSMPSLVCSVLRMALRHPVRRTDSRRPRPRGADEAIYGSQSVRYYRCNTHHAKGTCTNALHIRP
jgi:hypothetical protein